MSSKHQEHKKRLARKNYFLLALLVSLIVIFFAVTIVRM